MDFFSPYHIHTSKDDTFPVPDPVALESCFLVHSDGVVIFGCEMQKRSDNYERVEF